MVDLTKINVCVVVGVVVLATGMCSLSASARPAPGDVAATSSYLQADYAFVRVVAAHLGSSQTELQKLLARVRDECPNAAAGSPQDSQSTQLSDELIGAMLLNAARTDRQAALRFSSTVRGLRWSSRALTAAIQGYAGKLRTLSGLTAPPLCADVRSWAASGFKALPSATPRFDAVFMPAWVSAGELPPQLAAFEQPQTRTLAARAEHLEALVSDFEAQAVETYAQIMNALALLP
jgi:hypothetical protein